MLSESETINGFWHVIKCLKNGTYLEYVNKPLTDI